MKFKSTNEKTPLDVMIEHYEYHMKFRIICMDIKEKFEFHDKKAKEFEKIINILR